MMAQDSVPLNGTVANQSVGERFVCEICRRPFDTSRGLGQHKRLGHPVEYNREIVVERVKPRWSEEEMEMVAREEVKAIRSGVANMNQHLQSVFPERTLESVKGKRKSEAYKNMVKRLVDEEGNTDDAAEQNSASNSEFGTDNSANDAIKDEIKNLVESLKDNTLQNTQVLVEYARSVLNGNPLQPGTLFRWLKTTFKDAKPPRGIMYRGPIVSTNVSNKKRRKQEYAILQKMYVRDFGSAARRVLSGGDQEVTMPPVEEVVDFWKRIFEKEPEEQASANIQYEAKDQLQGVWASVSIDEVKACELDLESSAGPDGITVANWRGVCLKVRALFYNLVLVNGSLDNELKRARTVLIPKGYGNIKAGDTRPLSITSVVVRQLHKIFAKRFKTLHCFDPCQRAFIDCDGTVENLSVISTILADSRMSRREVHIATLDLRKAFDSVSHKTIIDTITELGLPKQFINYIKVLYTDSKTTLQYDSRDTILKVRQGVLQGDPISPLLFNAVMDRAIKQLPEGIGYKLNGMLFNCIAYADDIILIASTKRGLQASIDVLTSCLASFGLETNIEKSSTLSMVPSGRDKKVKVIEESQFAVDGTPLRAIGILDTWKYLGIYFAGSEKSDRGCAFAADLEKVSKAPLKPQQRLKILCTVVMPRHLHTLVLGRTTKGKLDGLDMVIRNYVRKWLHFPKDVPLAYFYADVNDGGLGIPILSSQVPMIRKARLMRFINKETCTSQVFKQSLYIQRQLEWCDEMLAYLGEDASKSKKSRYWRDVLLNMVDTNDLKDARHDGASNRWVRNYAHEVTGQDFMHYHHIRTGCLPSKARTTRGRRHDRRCRAGCMVSETNYHIIQQCHRTHGGRVLRHDRIVNLLCDNMRGRPNLKVLKEQRFRTEVGLRKPDLLIYNNEKAIVLDVQIVSGRDMERDHNAKIAKYRDIRGFEDIIKQKCATSTVEFHALTISYKGLIEARSSKLLNKLHINERLKFMMVTSVLRGGWLNWKTFNKMTTMARRTLFNP